MLKRLSHAQYATGWVLCQVGRALFEMVDFAQAASAFEWARQVDRARLEVRTALQTLLYPGHERRAVHHGQAAWCMLSCLGCPGSFCLRVGSSGGQGQAGGEIFIPDTACPLGASSAQCKQCTVPGPCNRFARYAQSKLSALPAEASGGPGHGAVQHRAVAHKAQSLDLSHLHVPGPS